jgi:hypothetical protein
MEFVVFILWATIFSVVVLIFQELKKINQKLK